MHELSIAQRIIEVIEAEAQKCGISKVRRARLKIGKMSAFQKEQLEFCLSTYEKSEALKDMRFSIEEVPVCLMCGSCRLEYIDDRFDDSEFAHDVAHAPALYLPPPCPSCNGEAKIIKGNELELVNIEGE